MQVGQYVDYTNPAGEKVRARITQVDNSLTEAVFQTSLGDWVEESQLNETSNESVMLNG
jgi:hypothetical protein